MGIPGLISVQIAYLFTCGGANLKCPCHISKMYTSVSCTESPAALFCWLDYLMKLYCLGRILNATRVAKAKIEGARRRYLRRSCARLNRMPSMPPSRRNIFERRKQTANKERVKDILDSYRRNSQKNSFLRLTADAKELRPARCDYPRQRSTKS